MDQNVGSFKSLILAHSPENIPTLQQRTVKAGHCVDKVMRVWRLLRVRTQFSKAPAPLPPGPGQEVLPVSLPGWEWKEKGAQLLC